MSSNIKVQKICTNCGKEFEAKTTVTKYCGLSCARKGHKAKVKESKISTSNADTERIKEQRYLDFKRKEFLTVKETAMLLGCSLRTVYYYIDIGTIHAANLGKRITRVKRSELERLFDKPLPQPESTSDKEYDLSECYTTMEIREKHGISESALRAIILKNKIPRFRHGVYAYIPKELIDPFFTKNAQ